MTPRGLLHSVEIRNILSYGPMSEPIELGPLNVLIGPNGSGKSNLLEAVSILQATPSDLARAFRNGAGVADWVWKARTSANASEVQAVVSFPEGPTPLHYSLAFAVTDGRLELVGEDVRNELPAQEGTELAPFYSFNHGEPGLAWRANPTAPPGSLVGRERRVLRRGEVRLQQSILSQRRDPSSMPELTWLAEQFGRIRYYSEWNFGRHSSVRNGQAADLPGDFLDEDGGNLALVLSDMLTRPQVKQRLVENLQQFYEPVTDMMTRVVGDSVQVHLHERGLRQSVPAARLSDGTLRYLCLLVILCHPEPPPLVMLEHPELGLHPDILPAVAELLLQASERTQLIVTTHSNTLVSALSEHPEVVLVCEKDLAEEGTRVRRLSWDRLATWLEKYPLGDVWRMGEIGGNRW